MRTPAKAEKIPTDSKPPVCRVACSRDLLSDKWTLLLVRDLLLGKRSYGEPQPSPEGIPTNSLAGWLKRLRAEGIAYRTAYRERPRRYACCLTDKGTDLMPVLRSRVQWVGRRVPGALSLVAAESRIRQKRASCKSPS
jgi:DNA-binding HxlR family transcriptional regulator